MTHPEIPLPAADRPSPFLPGTKIQFAFDSTSLGLLKTCPKLYYYIMIEGWQPKGENIHLFFGGEYHQALQDYDIARAEGASHEDALREIIHELFARTVDFAPDPETKAGKYKSRSNLIRLVIDYLDNYRDDIAKTYILSNGKPAVELSFRIELPWGPTEDQPYLLCGHMDRVVDWNDSLFVVDHKTTTMSLGSYFFDQFEPSNQMSLYSYAAQILLEAPIKGVIINGAQILVGSSKFQRAFTFRTKDILEEWIQDASMWFNLAEAYAKNEYWPHNDTACDKFGGCKFRSVCAKSPGVREIYLKSDFNKLEESERWNPLKSR